MHLPREFRRTAVALRSGHAWTAEESAAFHASRLPKLARHAYERTAFYRRLWRDAGVEPGDIRTLADFRKLPITEKADLQGAGTSSIAEGYSPSRLALHRTGGSSGQPLEIRRTAFEDKLLQAIRVRRLMRMYGVRWSDRRTTIRVDRKKWNPGLYARLGILRLRTVDCRLPVDVQVRQIIDNKPDLLSGYPCNLADVADRIGGALPNLRCVISAGDCLTQPLREQIKAGFGKPPRNAYGAHECNLLALSCSKEAFHVAEESVFLEVIAEDGSPAAIGQQGEAVITALHTFSMPIIRYRLGDLVRLAEPCECGVAGHTLSEITGRTVDLFERPDGTTYHPLTIVLPLQSIGRGLIRTFRVTQHSPQRMTILIEPRGEFSDERIQQIRHATQAAAGHPMDLEVRLAHGLVAEPNGKFRAFCRESTAAG